MPIPRLGIWKSLCRTCFHIEILAKYDNIITNKQKALILIVSRVIHKKKQEHISIIYFASHISTNFSFHVFTFDSLINIQTQRGIIQKKHTGQLKASDIRVYIKVHVNNGTHSCIAKKLDTNKSRFKIANEWLPKLGTTGHGRSILIASNIGDINEI